MMGCNLSSFGRFQWAILISYIFIAPPPTFGEEPATGEKRATGLEEIVVTAERRESSLQETPISITAFTAEALEMAGAHTAYEISERTPNLLILKQPSSNSAMGASIRGITTAEPSLNIDAKIAIYLDGVYIGKNAGAIFDVVDVERIEVLRGPQGTLFGKNTTGGAINIVTKKPKGEWGFKQQLTFGNYGRFRSQTSIDLPKLYNVSTKVSYNKNEFDGWARNINPRGPRNLGSIDDDAYRVALLWEPTDNFTAEYNFDKTKGEDVAKAFQISAVNPGYDTALTIQSLVPFVPVANPFAELLASGTVGRNKRLDRFNLDNQNYEETDISGHNLTMTWDLDGQTTLKSITAYRSLQINVKPGGTDLDGGAWSIPIFHAATIASNGNQKWHRQFSEELQVLGTGYFDGKLDVTGGFFYHNEKGKELNNQWGALIPLPAGNPFTGVFTLWEQNNFYAFLDSLPPPVGTGSVPGSPVPGGLGEDYSMANHSYAVYTQAKWHFTDQLTLTLGGRYTWDHKEVRILDATPNLKNDEDWDKGTWDVTLDYDWTTELNTYAKVATGYTAGSIPNRTVNEAAFNLVADPENLTDYEVGIKSDWLDNRLRVNLAGFYYDYDDIQIADFQAGATVLVNAGKAKMRGLELEVVTIPVEGLTLSATYGYLHPEYDKFEVTVALAGGGSITEDIAKTAKFPYAPTHTGSATAQYDFPPLEFGQFTAMVTGTYTDSYVFNPRLTTRDYARSRYLIDARIELSQIPIPNGNLRVGVWGKNLTDKDYKEWGIDFSDLGIAGNTWGDPRTYGVDIVYEF